MAEQSSAQPPRRRLPLHAIDARVRAELARGEPATAAATAAGFFGPEVYGFITTTLAGRRGAHGVYACFAAELGRELPAFGWRCELRVFAYYLARRALRQHREGAAEGAAAALVPAALVHLPAHLPTHRRTRRLAVLTLRSALAPLDRELLVLRIDRRLRWSDLAITSLGEAAAVAALDAEARRLRERFRALRLRLRALTPPEGGAR